MSVRDIRQYCQLDAAGERLLEQAMQHFGLSARAYDRILKVARTIDAVQAGELSISRAYDESRGFKSSSSLTLPMY